MGLSISFLEFGTLVYQLSQRLKSCKSVLLDWRKDRGRNSGARLNFLKQNLKVIQKEDVNGSRREIEEKVLKEIEESEESEELYWKQRSRVNWL